MFIDGIFSMRFYIQSPLIVQKSEKDSGQQAMWMEPHTNQDMAVWKYGTFESNG